MPGHGRRNASDCSKPAAGGTFVPLAFAPGEAFQFDWSEEFANIGGLRVKLQVANFKLSYSRAFTQRAYPLQTHERLFDAHNHAFRVLGGVPQVARRQTGNPARGKSPDRAGPGQ